ncbi:MAG: hypothetical protein AUI14_15060 [Actinobacteria bacterium 13_2_20CM_2_71_6]|nr:MAG: hypothetical protein AUI14_15060 [Actinobacteria bacterium 13_2_20CM_2_71_6]
MLVVISLVLGLASDVVANRIAGDFPVWIPVLLILPLTAMVIVVQLRLRRSDHRQDAGKVVEGAMNALFVAVKDQWNREASLLDIGPNADRLPVSWRPAEARMFSSFDEVRQIAAGIPEDDRTSADSRGDSPDDVKEIGLHLGRVWLTEVPSRRLVLLGDAGSGKTELLIRMMRSLLDRKMPGERIPVLLSAASWDPGSTGFDDWVVESLSTNYSFLSQRLPGTDQTLARTLLDRKRLALVVDGLDELPGEQAATAIKRINSWLPVGQYLLLSSRREEYGAATGAGQLSAAMGIVLNAQSPVPVLAYLRKEAKGHPDRWNGVADRLRDPAAPLAEVLETPLMVMLADAVYNASGRTDDRPGPDELLVHTDAEDVRKHLLDGFLDLRYAGGRSNPWKRGDTRYWLGHLAETLERKDATNLVWWELPLPLPTGRQWTIVKYVVTPVVALLWTAISAAVMNGLVLHDLNRGLTNAVRISAAAVVAYAALLYLSRSYGAAVLAILGAYIAGTMSGIYHLAIVAGLAAGLSWSPVTRERARPRDALAVATVVSAVPALIRVAGWLSPLHPETSLVKGFAGGFADGWVNRWDDDVSGFVGTFAIASLVIWVAMRWSYPSAVAVRQPCLLFGRWEFPSRRSSVNGLVVGVLVALLDGWFDGMGENIVDGWRLAPADGFAIGFAMWFVAAWSQRLAGGTDARGWAVRWPGATSVLVGLAGAALNLLAFSTRTDIPNIWANAAAEGIAIGLLTRVTLVQWTAPDPPVEREPPHPQGERSVPLLDWLCLIVPPAIVGLVVGALDAYSAGAAGAAYGFAVFTIIGYWSYRRSPLSRRHEPEPDVKRSEATQPGLRGVRAIDAGVATTAVVGIVAGFGYGLVYGVVIALAVKVALEIRQRSQPSTGTASSRIGIVGGAVLGSMVAFGASFSDIGVVWAVPIGLTSAAAAIFAFGTVGEPADDTLVMSPRRLLALDRQAFLRSTLGLATTIGVAAGTWTAAVHGTRAALLATLGTIATYGLSAGLVVAAAQCRFVPYTVARTWLAAHGNLPWRLMGFLDDAYARGVLRRNGAVYQFRHELLQKRLAELHRRSASTPST